MTCRRGSFLVVCITLMSLMIVLTFAILHEMRAQIETSTGNQPYLLAEAAARSGLDHAVEAILTDYNQKTLTLRSGLVTNVPVPAITFLDGQFRSPFTAIANPNTNASWSDTNSASNDNDVRAEDYVMRPWAWWWFEVGNWWNSGLLMYDGRGRYFEPGYYNFTPTVAGTVTYPLVPTGFVDPNATVPERSQGMFYDDQYRRVPPSGNPQLDRQQARYRLRYTVGVEDLSGHLLINPIPDMQMLTQKDNAPTSVDYRNPEQRYPWMPASMNALIAITGGPNSGMFGCQLSNVFEGRGYWTNVDFDHSPSGLSGWPKTFPLTYRDHFEPGASSGHWGSWIDGINDSGSLATNLFWFNPGVPPYGLEAGGEVIPNWSWNAGVNNWPYDFRAINHCLVGPQLSFDNALYAALGERAYLGTQEGDGNYSIQWDKFGITPFGRGLTTLNFNPLTPKYYQARVNTPFNYNLMTAPPAIISGAITAYLPPREKIFKYTGIVWVPCTGFDQNNNPTYGPGTSASIDPSNPLNQGSFYGRDLLVDTTCPPAFSQWPAPTRDDNNPQFFPDGVTPTNAQFPPTAPAPNPTIKPDYFAGDVRDPLLTYPGPLMNGSIPSQPPMWNPTAQPLPQATDDLGQNMNELSLGGGLDLYDGQPFVNIQAGWPQQQLKNFAGNPPNLPAGVAAFANWATTNPPPGWGSSPYDYAVKTPDPNKVLHTYSYYFDLMAGLATAISVFRAEYIEYDLPWIQAANIFGGGGDPEPQNFKTLRDLDKLFLSEMGESLDHPGAGTPAFLISQKPPMITPYQVHYGGSQPAITNDFQPANNILSLMQSGSIAENSITAMSRAHVMELLLNDFRMSFFGSSPGYSDVLDPTTLAPNPNLEFRPLDFIGDGIAYCSCYTGAGSTDKDGLPCAPAGTKPPTYFTITGNFFIGKSHFYRVFSRGEVWDNLMGRKVNDATLDSALAVDPEGNNPTQTQFLYQRWYYNRYLAMLPHVQR